MALPEANVVVKRTPKGVMRVFVDGKMMVGTIRVVLEGAPEPMLKLEILGRFVKVKDEP
jgi:hypothetical protein